MRNELAAKVKAVNNANAYAATIYPLLVEALKPFVGQQVEKVTGDLLLKVEKVLPKFPSSVALHVYRHRSNYSLAWTVKTCESIPPHSCTYHEVTVYIGDLNNGVLTKLSPPFEGRADYTVEEVEANREAYKAAKKLADEAHGKLYPFGEYDR